MYRVFYFLELKSDTGCDLLLKANESPLLECIWWQRTITIHRQTKTKKPDGFHGDWCKFAPRGSREARRDSQAQKRKEEVNDILRMSAAATKPLIETVAKLGVTTYMYTLLHSRCTTEEVFRTAWYVAKFCCVFVATVPCHWHGPPVGVPVCFKLLRCQ